MARYSRRQCLVLIVFGASQFCNAVCISIQAPFYPAEAEAKGATPTQYGLVFGVYELIVFIASPFYGKYLSRLGPKITCCSGLVTASAMCVMFGLLDYIETTTAFIGLSFTVRIVEALGGAAYITSAFSIIALEFPDGVATAFAVLETGFGLGLIVGPTVGGALYQVGGYVVCFAAFGGLLFAAAMVTMLVLPPPSTTDTVVEKSADSIVSTDVENEVIISDNSTESIESILPSDVDCHPVVCNGSAVHNHANAADRVVGNGTVVSNACLSRPNPSRPTVFLLRIPPILIAAFTTVSAAISIGFLQATLEPHLRQFSLTPFQLGLLFMLNGMMYGASTPFWAFVCGRQVSSRVIIFLGAMLIAVALILIGPVPFVPLPTTLAQCIVALVLQGAGLGAELVATFSGAQRDAIATGLPDDMTTYGLISGMWTSCFALGSFVGPSLGGALIDAVGFEWATLPVALIHFVVAIISICYCVSVETNPPRITAAEVHVDVEASTLIKQDCNVNYGTAA